MPLAFHGVDDLVVLAGAERRDCQHLGFAAREQRRTMGARQYAGRHRQRTHREQIATIDAWRAIENAVADDLGFGLMERSDERRVRKEWVRKCRFRVSPEQLK